MFSDVLLFLQWRYKRMRCWVRSTISKGAALHISGSIANQLVLNLPAFLHFTEHTVHSWRGEQPGWVAHGQIEDVAKARPRAESLLGAVCKSFSVFSDPNFTCYNKLQVTSYNHIILDIKPLECNTGTPVDPNHSRLHWAVLARSTSRHRSFVRSQFHRLGTKMWTFFSLPKLTVFVDYTKKNLLDTLNINCIHHLMGYHDMI